GARGEAGRRRRRRRGGRARGRGEESPAAGNGADASSRDDTDGDGEGAEEPAVGGLSAEARTAALAATGVLEADGDEAAADQEDEGAMAHDEELPEEARDEAPSGAHEGRPLEGAALASEEAGPDLESEEEEEAEGEGAAGEEEPEEPIEGGFGTG